MPTLAAIAAVYPERADARPGKLERVLAALRYASGKLAARGQPLRAIVAATNAHAQSLHPLADAQLGERAGALRPKLRASGFTQPGLAGEAFALVREAAGRTLQMRHFDVQLIGAFAMLRGRLAEMETGEGKTLTATLAAATAALAGQAVHVVTVNDYLAERDSATLRPLYELLGLHVACVKQGMSPAERRIAYRCDIVYCSNKEIAFDYLRDRLVLGGKPRPISMRLAALDGAGCRRATAAARSAVCDRRRGR